MSDSPKATDTLIPVIKEIALDGTIYRIPPYSMAKTWIVLQTLLEVAEAGGIGAAFAGLMGVDNTPSILEVGKRASTLEKITEVVPQLLAKGNKPFYKLLGILVTTSAELRRLEEEEQSIDRHCLDVGRKIAYSDSVSLREIMELISVSLSQINAEAVTAAFPKLPAVLSRLTNLSTQL